MDVDGGMKAAAMPVNNWRYCVVLRLTLVTLIHADAWFNISRMVVFISLWSFVRISFSLKYSECDNFDTIPDNIIVAFTVDFFDIRQSACSTFQQALDFNCLVMNSSPFSQLACIRASAFASCWFVWVIRLACLFNSSIFISFSADEYTSFHRDSEEWLDAMYTEPMPIP